jgi:pimeloyl-ACP methyl ester carboxylesterase
MTTTTQISPQKSTTVRATSAQLTVLRTAFRTLDRVAPQVGGRWAARLWFTLPRPNGRSRDDRPELPSTLATIRFSDGRRVAAEVWGDGLPVYLVHGWGGWRGQLGAFVEPLVSRGYSVVGFDSFSHGDSSAGRHGPRRTTGAEMIEALAAAVDHFGQPAGIVAHSLGSAMTAAAIGHGLPAPARLAMVAPTLGPVPHIRAMANLLGFSDRTQQAMQDRLEAVINRPLTDFDTLNLPRPMPATLIVHDRHDKEVPIAEGVQIASAWPTTELVATEGLGHRRILRDPGVVERVTDFVAAGA